MSFTELLGPLTCEPVQDNCAAHWERIQGVLGIGPAPDGGPGGGGPDGGPADAGPSPPPSNPGQQRSGCSTTGESGVLFLSLIIVLLLWRMRS
jgi:hypothetical protein